MRKTKCKTVSLIGGAGFVGTRLAQYLSDRGVPFEIIDLKSSKSFPHQSKLADVRDKDSLTKTVQGEVVVNLAAVHRDDVRDRREYFLTNVVGAENVAQVCTDKNIQKIVFTSSVAVYGFATPGTSEDGKIDPFNEYGLTKFQAEECFRAWHSAGDGKRSLFIIRPTVIFGEGNRGNVYNLLRQISSNRFVMVGAGTNQKSLAYVGNVASFLGHCIFSPNNYLLSNYADTPDFDMNSLVSVVRLKLHKKRGVGVRLPYPVGAAIGRAADALAVISGAKFPVSYIRVKKFCATTQFLCLSPAFAEFEAPYTLQEGIERTLKTEFISPDPKQEIFFTE